MINILIEEINTENLNKNLHLISKLTNFLKILFIINNACFLLIFWLFYYSD